MKRMVIFSLMMLLYASSVFALTLTQDNMQEIDMRWGAIFNAELSGKQKRMDVELFERYKERLLAIDQNDIVLAEQLIVRLCQGELWDLFVQRKDKSAILSYIDMLTSALQRYVDPRCNLSFPPSLEKLEQNIASSKLSPNEYCTKVRRAFLAFTIIVSKMNYIAQQ